jgi:hypothetical protein
VGIPVKPILSKFVSTKNCFHIHKADTLAKGTRKPVEDVHCWNEPLCELVIGILGLSERRDLFLKDCEDGIGRVAGLKGGK